MPAIKPKQTEQNASLAFIMETDFDSDEEAGKIIRKLEQEKELASIKRK